MRAGMAPTEAFDALDIQHQNIIGSNVGNLLYQYSISRTLATEGTSIEVNRYRYGLGDVDRINQECSCFIIPLADAFRAEFMSELKKITELVKKLTIPCVVIGVGLRAPFEPNLKEGFPFDDTVKDFVKAVLEKSSIIGVRGELTAQYLTTLGFREGIDHTVIGCPSLYTFGRTLNIKSTPITTASKVSMNASSLSPQLVNEFVFRSGEKFREANFVPQLQKELMMLYSGKHYHNKAVGYYPSTIEDTLFTSGHARFFLNAPTWFDYFHDVDFTFGSRLHGNIAGILGGSQSLLIPKDARTRELALYHNLAHIPYTDITPETDIFDLIERVDFQSPVKLQAQNFDHYIDFLNKNNLDHIYKDDIQRTTAPLDELMNQIEHYPPILPIVSCPPTEIAKRLTDSSKREGSRLCSLSEETKKLRENAKADKSTIDKLKKETEQLKKNNQTLSTNITNRVTRKVKTLIKK